MEFELDLEIILTLFYTALKIIRFAMAPFFALVYRRKKNRLPQIKHDFLELPAVELAEKIRRKKVSSVNVVKLFIERIRQVNPIINAVADERFEDALQDARVVDQMVLTMPPHELLEKYPLLGVPFSISENLGVKDCQYAAGTIAKGNVKAEKDGEVVRVLRAAGAIPLCVTNVSEWTLSWECDNFLHGRTNNPYDLSCNAGGSVGGEGALLAAGASPFGIGADMAGDLRISSHCCGIFGHKPTAGLVDLDGHYPPLPDYSYGKYATIGPMARFSKDLLPLLSIMSNHNPGLRLSQPVYTKNIRIFYNYHFNNVKFEIVGVTRSIKSCMKKALEHFKLNQNFVKESRIDLSHCIYIGALLFFDTDLPDLLHMEGETPSNVFYEFGMSFIGRSDHTISALMITVMHEMKMLASHEKIKRYKDELECIKQQFMEMLKDDGVFLIPTFATPAFQHNESLSLWSAIPYTQIFNLLGFPSTHVPMGLNWSGLPVGFQVVAAPYQDRLCLAIASELEKAFGGWKAPRERIEKETQLMTF